MSHMEVLLHNVQHSRESHWVIALKTKKLHSKLLWTWNCISSTATQVAYHRNISKETTSLDNHPRARVHPQLLAFWQVLRATTTAKVPSRMAILVAHPTRGVFSLTMDLAVEHQHFWIILGIYTIIIIQISIFRHRMVIKQWISAQV